LSLLLSASLDIRAQQNQSLLEAKADSLVDLMMTAGRNWNEYAHHLVSIGEASVPPLLRALNDRSLDQFPRRTASMTLSDINSESIIEPGMKIMFDDTELLVIRNGMIPVIRKYDLSPYKDDIWDLYQSTDEYFHNNLASLLIDCDPERAYQAYEDLYEIGDSWGKRSALNTLIMLKPEFAGKWLMRGLQEDDWMTSKLAMDSILTSRHIDSKALADLFEDPKTDEILKWRLTYLFGNRSWPESEEILEAASKDESWLVRIEGKLGLERLDTLIPSSCTIFGFHKDDQSFFGNNEDYKNLTTLYWVIPKKEHPYGVLCLGFGNFFAQGGVNEKGLAFDGNGLPPIKMKNIRNAKEPPHSHMALVLLQHCSTVEEAVKMAGEYNWAEAYRGELGGQFLMADANGDAVVISANKNGEISFTRKPKGNGYLVSTNFNRANHKNRYGDLPCWRYNKASEMLSTLDKKETVTVDQLKGVLDGVHVEGKNHQTQYSNLFDLSNGIMYLYYKHQFDKPLVINFKEEIRKEPPARKLAELF
jgi:hypothetical protein